MHAHTTENKNAFVVDVWAHQLSGRNVADIYSVTGIIFPFKEKYRPNGQSVTSKNSKV